jgi:nucleoside-diphosphate-sugar epimerase
MEKTIVIGGSGFIGRAVQKYVVNKQIGEAFAFAYNRHPENVRNSLDKVRIDLLDKNTLGGIAKFSRAIYVSGSADHGLAKSSLVLLSSQAVYYGFKGEILESVDHVPTIPYGLSKKMVEAYANYFLTRVALAKLWTFRLMYAFGEGEKEGRLIPRCAKAASNDERVTIFGGGKSFLNPLPSLFVAETLVKAAKDLEKRDKDFLEITNLNYPESVTVGDVVRFLSGVQNFDYEIAESGEEWPVEFWGDTRNLSRHMKRWNLSFPDLWDDLKQYFKVLLRGKQLG